MRRVTRKNLPEFFLSLCALFLPACVGRGPDSPVPLTLSQAQRARYCRDPQTPARIPERPYNGGASATKSFDDIRGALKSACFSCHGAPANKGGFTYLDSYQGQETTIGGVTQFYPGLVESAEKIATALLHDDPARRMPPLSHRKHDEEAFFRLGRDVMSWISAGKPQGSFLPGGAPAPPPEEGLPFHETTDLGDCLPDPAIVGFDYKKDREFERMEKLPATLSETDMFSLDAFELAQKGTIAYNVEYPLWADNAEKGRWIHVPMKIVGGRLERQSVQYDTETKTWKIPENTRFYKTFYRKVVTKDKRVRFRRMETRIIVARTPFTKALFGTYRWDDAEQTATLIQTPYRDGTPFKDTISDVVIDEKKGTVRPYAIPGRHRCIECHMGGTMDNFILGFTPMQINRRPVGEGGREDPVGEAELTQVARLVKYGILSSGDEAGMGLTDNQTLPKLEWAARPQAKPRNVYELRAMGYFFGNCMHCHNAKGYALQPENGIELKLEPHAVFNINTKLMSKQIFRKIVDDEGEPERSHIYRKVADPLFAQGIYSQMPLHTPGAPDCKALRVLGKWIKSIRSPGEAAAWEPECRAMNEWTWIDQDFTSPPADQWTPRRADWQDPAFGMKDKYRQLEFSQLLKEAVKKEYTIGYWNTRSRKLGQECSFPEINLPPEEQRPWMIDPVTRKPKRPFGQVYKATPGSWFFQSTCSKCHGVEADGDSGLARGILNWSGGSVQVANLSGGLFLPDNLKKFNVVQNGVERNLAGNYMIWMAMEGTRVQFPPKAAEFIGPHGGQMLYLIRDKCLRQIWPEKLSKDIYMDHEVYRVVCFHENRSPGDPDLAFGRNGKPVNPAAVEAWLDQATFNAGWAIFQYLTDMSQGVRPATNNECDRKFPIAPGSGG